MKTTKCYDDFFVLAIGNCRFYTTRRIIRPWYKNVLCFEHVFRSENKGAKSKKIIEIGLHYFNTVFNFFKMQVAYNVHLSFLTT